MYRVSHMLIIEYCGNTTVNKLSESGDGDAALVLTALMTIMNRLLMVVKQSIVAENLMTSVERILEYGALKQEAYLKDICGPFNITLQGRHGRSCPEFLFEALKFRWGSTSSTQKASV